LARALDRLPTKFIFYGVDASNFAAGADLSPEVGRAADEVVRRVLDEVATWAASST
jgi:hypothetical protein